MPINCGMDWFTRRILIWHLSPIFFLFVISTFFSFPLCCYIFAELNTAISHRQCFMLSTEKKRTNLLWDCYTILWNNVIFCKIPLVQTFHTFRDFVVSFFLFFKWHALWHLSWTMQKFTLYQGHTVLVEPVCAFLRSLSQQRFKFATTVIIYMWGIFGGASVVIDFQKWWYVMEYSTSTSHLGLIRKQ